MDKKSLLVLLLLSSVLLALLPSFGLIAKANPSIIKVPDDAPTIQAAVDYATVGDTIVVKTGIYVEHVVVRKTLTLTGAGKDICVIDGSGLGTTLWIEADNVLVSGFTIRNGGSEGVFLNYTTGAKVFDNIITSNQFYGVSLEYSTGNTIMNNFISDNRWGLGAFSSSGNLVRYNVLTLNVGGSGVDLETSHNNVFEGNTVSNNGDGISLYQSNGNTIYRNNFVSNSFQALAFESVNNLWDNGAEGNYWNDYTGQDIEGDGIGNIPYTIDSATNMKDVYPLVEPWSLSRIFPVGTWQGANYYVGVVANSTVAGFGYNQSLKEVSFNVTGPQGTSSFCNVTIPKPILDGDPWTVLLGATNISAIVNLDENDTHTFLSFTHMHSTLPVRIIGTYVQAGQLEIHNVVVIDVSFYPKELRAGGNVSIMTIVRNVGSFAETFNVTLFYDGKAIDNRTITSLLAGESMNLNFTWNTAGVIPGHYSIRAQASAIVDETDTLDNTRTADEMVFVMRPLIHNVAVISLSPTPTQATIGQNVQITVLVKNRGDFAESFSVSVYYNDTVVGIALEVPNLAENATESLVFTWITEDAVEGTYVITAKASMVLGEMDQLDNNLTSVEYVTLKRSPSFFQPIFLLPAVITFMVIIVVYWHLRGKRAGKPK